MSDVYNFLKEQAAEQLNKQTAKVTDGSWFDSTISALRNEISSSNLDDASKGASEKTLVYLEDNRETLIGLGKHAFNLLMFQISMGKNQEAISTYIGALTNADDLIDLMNSGANGVIKAKLELDALHASALSLIKDIFMMGLRYLIPFLLSLA